VGYALAQFAKALQSAGKTAADRVQQWRDVIVGIDGGLLDVGSRTPVADTPPWVTLEVVHGGFATGRYEAGGPLQPHERALVARLGVPEDRDARLRLNSYFLSDAGRAELRHLLHEGAYRIAVPEHAALLMVTWLLDHSLAERATAVLDQIAPWFSRLAFYPIATDRAKPVLDGTFLESVADVSRRLGAHHLQRSLHAQRESVLICAPLHDQLVALWLSTVRGPPPHFERSPDGSLLRQSNGQPKIAGGWPCATYPEDFAQQARTLLNEFAEISAHAHAPPNKGATRLRLFLEQWLQDGASLTERDVGAIRTLLAGHINKYGTPKSERNAAIRDRQRRDCCGHTHPLIAQRVQQKLSAFDATQGVAPSSLALLRSEVCQELQLTALPEAIERKLDRCLHAPLEQLLAEKVVRSSEVLAKCLLPISAETRGKSLENPSLRRLFVECYLSFGARRSLLLLNYNSQVRFEELPWIIAIKDQLQRDADGVNAARDLLAHAVTLTVRYFGANVFPNKLIRELHAIAASAGMNIPLVYELAADIFMGQFTDVFARAALAARPLVAGTLYARYYDVSTDGLRSASMPPVAVKSAISPEFSQLIVRRVQAELQGQAMPKNPVVANAMHIEQAQIVTTHNIATLIAQLGLHSVLGPQYGGLARQSFERCIQYLTRLSPTHIRSQMQSAKRAAYAWRHCVLFLSFVSTDEQQEWLRWADARLARASREFVARFMPAMQGLRVCIAGGSFGPGGQMVGASGRRFLGWTNGRHWLLPPSPTRV
jgi:hypothetical protein